MEENAIKTNVIKVFWVIVLIFFYLLFSTTTIAAVKEPRVIAGSAIVMDYKSGRVLWGKNINKQAPMASTTKIMTCILALEKGNLNDIVTVSDKAARAPRVKLFLQKGEQERMGDLLYGLMLVSANDVAVAVAEHIGGSVENFCKAMTEKARELGAKNTIFETPNGLDSKNHHSTVYDMAMITKYAINNPKFMEIINTRNMVIRSTNRNTRVYSLSNHNRLLSELDGANGVKTGYTGGAGHCFVGSAKRGDMQLISVVLGSSKMGKWTDTKAIMEYAFRNFKYKKILEKEEIITENINVLKCRGEKLNLCVKSDIEMPMNQSSEEEVTLEVYYPERIEAPIKKGMEIGAGKIYINGEYTTDVSLFADRSIEENTFESNLKKIYKRYAGSQMVR